VNRTLEKPIKFEFIFNREFFLGGGGGVPLPKRLNKFVNCVTFSNDLLPEVRFISQIHCCHGYR